MVNKIKLPEEPTGPYIVTGDTDHGCCHSAVVVDSSQGKEDYGDYWKKKVCECFEVEDAIRIATALNQLEERTKNGYYADALDPKTTG